MTRDIKRQIHIYFPEASHRGNKVDLCECFFIKHSFQRKVRKAVIRYYANEFEGNFKDAISIKNKKNLRSLTIYFLLCWILILKQTEVMQVL